MLMAINRQRRYGITMVTAATTAVPENTTDTVNTVTSLDIGTLSTITASMVVFTGTMTVGASVISTVTAGTGNGTVISIPRIAIIGAESSGRTTGTGEKGFTEPPPFLGSQQLED
jgi:hypothetical protein